MSQKKAVAKRKVTVISRYYIKKSGVSNGVRYEAGSVVLRVRNDKGVEYYTTIRPNGIHSCECKATKTCYHITHCAGLESAREVAAEQELAAIALAKEVAAIVAEIVAEEEREAARETVPARELAPLNGNRSFSLLAKERAVA